MTAMLLNKSKIFLVLFFVLTILLGLTVRILPAIKGNIFFGFDQGLDIVMVKQLVVDHKINLISRYSGLQGVLMGPGWTWFLALPFWVSHGSPAANAIWLSLFSVFSSIMTFFIVKKLLGFIPAIFTYLVVMFAPFFVTNSQVVLSPHPLTYLFIFYLWFCYEVFINKQKKYFIPLGFVTGLFFQFEIAFAIFTLPPTLIMTIFFWNNIKKNIFSKEIFVGLLLFSLTFLPQLFFDLRHDFLITNSLWGFFTGANNSLYRETPPLLDRFFARWGSFREDFFKMTILINNQLINLSILFFAVLGWIIILKQKRIAEINFLKIIIIILLSFYIAFSFYPGAIWGWYRQGLPIVYVLLLTVPISALWKSFKILRLPILILGISLLFIFVNPLGFLSQSRSGINLQYDVLDYVYASANEEKFSSFTYTPPVYDYIWQYNYWQYGLKKYGYLPKNWEMAVPLLGIGKQIQPPSINEGIFYLIIEPDSERPWAPEGWKKSFIKIGKVLEIKQFPSGVIVEKRST